MSLGCRFIMRPVSLRRVNGRLNIHDRTVWRCYINLFTSLAFFSPSQHEAARCEVKSSVHCNNLRMSLPGPRPSTASVNNPKASCPNSRRHNRASQPLPPAVQEGRLRHLLVSSFCFGWVPHLAIDGLKPYRVWGCRFGGTKTKAASGRELGTGHDRREKSMANLRHQCSFAHVLQHLLPLPDFKLRPRLRKRDVDLLLPK